MKEDLLPYYEAELRFMREMFKQFGKDNQAVAKQLMVEGDRCDDPHVELLIQAFSLIAGRIRHKLDDEFPEITEALINVLYPHYIRPIPSLSIAQFEYDPSQGKPSARALVPRHTALLTKAITGSSTVCRFRTAYPVTLLPLRITSAQVVTMAPHLGPKAREAAAVIELRFECLGKTALASMGLSKLRLYLHGENELPFTLHELLLNSTSDVLISAGTDDSNVVGPFEFPKHSIRDVGFGKDEELFPYPSVSFRGYRWLSEYFALPQKFLFIDVEGFDALPLSKFNKTFSLTFLIDEFERKDRLRNLEKLVRADNFRLGCTPIANLFGRPAEPIRVTHTETEYRVIPSMLDPSAAEVYSIDRVSSIAPYLEQSQEYQPFYAVRHSYQNEMPDAFWFASRRSSSKAGDDGTEVYLSIVDKNFKPSRPADETLSVQVTCTNRDLPSKLPLAREFGEISIDGTSGIRARCLTKPTDALRPPLRSGLQWRLISHLALNHLSLTDSSGESLREIITLYNFTNDPALRNQIAGILSLNTRTSVARVLTPVGVAFPIGTRVDILLDEDRFAGSSAFLLASVLERFLGLYSSLNSFTQLTATSKQRKEAFRSWPPRTGEQILV